MGDIIRRHLSPLSVPVYIALNSISKAKKGRPLKAQDSCRIHVGTMKERVNLGPVLGLQDPLLAMLSKSLELQVTGLALTRLGSRQVRYPGPG